MMKHTRFWDEGSEVGDSVNGGGGQDTGVAAARLREHARELLKAVQEAYSPGMMAAKLFRVFLLRMCKAVAMVLNAVVGRMLLGWGKGESRVLDFVGMGTERLFWDLYGRELCREESIAFLYKRLYLCALTFTASLVQIMFEYFLGVYSVSLAITLLMLPVTVLDRQWTALVSRMQSRYDRSRVKRLALSLSCALEPVGTAHCMPTRFGLSGYNMLLGGAELCVAAAQLLSGLLIFGYTLWRATSPLEAPLEGVVWAMLGLRLLKECTNVVSPLIELRRQPAQFARNDACVQQILDGLCGCAKTPQELALLVHGHHEDSEEAFMRTCQALVGFVVCGWARGAGGGGDVELGPAGEEAKFLDHVHGPECLPAFVRGKWKGEEQRGMLALLLEAGQVGGCWWACLHGHAHGVDTTAPEIHSHMHVHARAGHAWAHASASEAHVHTHTHTLPDGRVITHAHPHCHPAASDHKHEGLGGGGAGGARL